MSIGSDITALNRRSSASPARAVAEGADSGKKPLRLSLLISRSIRLRSFPEDKPHQEGDAYISDAMVLQCSSSNLVYIGNPSGVSRENARSPQRLSSGPESITLANSDVAKLIPNLNDKKKYVLHYENLKLYESLGL